MDELTAPTRANTSERARSRRVRRLLRVTALTLGLFVFAGVTTACQTPQQEQAGALIDIFIAGLRR